MAMETDTRRIVFAFFVAMALLVGYQVVVNRLLPPPKAQPSDQPAPEATQPGPGTPTVPAAPETVPTTTSTTPTTAPRATYALVAAPEQQPVTLGGRDGDALRVELNPLGASVESIEFTARDDKGRYVRRMTTESEDPYKLLAPVVDGDWERYSFATHALRIEEFPHKEQQLGNLPWEVSEESPGEKVVFSTRLRSEQTGEDILRLTKTYTLRPGKPIFEVDVVVENLGPTPLTMQLEQDGPTGIHKEHLQYDMRRLLTTQHTDSGIELNKGYQWSALKDATLKGEPIQLLAGSKGPFVWTALANKYFAVYTRPLPLKGDFQDYIASAIGLSVAPNALDNQGDLLARLKTRPMVIAAGSALHVPLEVHAGPKDAGHLAKADPAFVDTTKLYYQSAKSADSRCACCTFDWLRDLMGWLLEHIRLVVQNYGVAIIILVVIIRGLLHPLTVFQQKSMFRMQDAMSRVQPKLDAVKERYANDKVKQNQEMMKLFSEEGVNPASNFVSFLPLILQMPILVALWTALNTDVNLRHAPFDGWWIDDLSAPDALIAFATPQNIPVLEWIPFIGAKLFCGFTSVNLLPILMGVSMWLQQKYMPKPHMKAKMEAARKRHEQQKSKSGMSPQDQIRQQQIMAYMMSILFPLMFYSMPSGLNLYWMATNVVGIFESLLIRKQLDEERQRREREGPPPPGKKRGLMSKVFKRIADQAEDLQRKADELAKTEGGKKKKKP